MTITVSVDATWRVGRIEIDTPYHDPGIVRGLGEVLVAESVKDSSKASDLFGTGKPYGAIPGENITRNNDEVMDDTVSISGGTEISWRTMMEALPLFLEKWRREDIENPPAKFIPPKASDPTHPQEIGDPRPGKDELPPPILS